MPTPPKTQIPVLRVQRGYKQYALAAKAKIETSRLCRIELGRVVPTDDERARLARALGVTADQLGV